MNYSSNRQLLLYFMKRGSSYEDSCTKVKDILKKKKSGWFFSRRVLS